MKFVMICETKSNAIYNSLQTHMQATVDKNVIYTDLRRKKLCNNITVVCIRNRFGRLVASPNIASYCKFIIKNITERVHLSLIRLK